MKYREIFENGKLQFTTIDGKVIQSYKTMAEKHIPILISEGGTNEYFHSCSNYTQPSADMMALGFTGVAGFNNWPGYQLDLNYNYEHFWKTLLRVQNHLNGDDVINTLSEGGGKWGMGWRRRNCE